MWYNVIFAVFFLLTFAFGNSPQRMELFDNSGNKLLFVEFEYDNNGNNIGRTVYAPDSTFMKRTTFTNDASGERSREQSFNFNDDTIGYTVFGTQGSKPEINVFDQFGLNQFGASVSYVSNGENTFDIYHNGVVVYKMNYHYTADKALSKVDICNIGGQVLYYAAFSNSSGVVKRSAVKKAKPQITLSPNWCRVSVSLEKETLLKACIYNISGQLVSVPFSKMCKAGYNKIQFPMNGTKKMANGIYIMRFFADDQQIGTENRCFTNMVTR
ncbi:MAG: hypothetical protein Q4F84_07285 [Fibrobacter sp.]|nr:hypothetical protein [Fibrobacter sp.]